MQHIISTLLLFLILTTNSFSQYDSVYVSNYNQNLMVKGFLYSNIMQLSTTKTGNKNSTDYSPNNPLCIGIGVAHKKLPFEIKIGHSLGTKGDDRYIKTEGTNLQLSRHGQTHFTYFYAQHYKGLYIDNLKMSPQQLNCPDLSIVQVGLVTQYLLNNKKFSYRAAFDQNEKQLLSAGSFIVGLGVYYFNVKSDSSFTYKNSNSIRSFQWGINGGYAYNWVIKKNLLIGGSITAGLNLGNSRIKNFFDRKLYVSPTMLAKTSVFYNAPKWSLGISFVLNMVSQQHPDNSEINLIAGQFDLSYIHRLNL